MQHAITIEQNYNFKGQSGKITIHTIEVTDAKLTETLNGLTVSLSTYVDRLQKRRVAKG